MNEPSVFKLSSGIAKKNHQRLSTLILRRVSVSPECLKDKLIRALSLEVSSGLCCYLMVRVDFGSFFSRALFGQRQKRYQSRHQAGEEMGQIPYKLWDAPAALPGLEQSSIAALRERVT